MAKMNLLFSVHLLNVMQRCPMLPRLCEPAEHIYGEKLMTKITPSKKQGGLSQDSGTELRVGANIPTGDNFERLRATLQPT